MMFELESVILVKLFNLFGFMVDDVAQGGGEGCFAVQGLDAAHVED